MNTPAAATPQPGSMPLSVMAKSFGTGTFGFLPMDSIGHFVRERGLYPRDGTMERREGEEVAQLLRLQSLQQIENRINGLAAELRQAKDRHEAAMGQAVDLAQTASDPYELHYLVHMFMLQRQVLRAAARNPNLSEKTQFLMASMGEMQKDREIQLALAHNPALCPQAMEKILESTEDVFVLQGLAHNAARQSRAPKTDPAYAEVCKKLALVHWDTTLAKAAIPGVKDAETLRYLADHNSPLYAADKLEAVAQNPHTPDDVLARMASTPLARMQHAVGIDYASKARHTLEVKRQQKTQEHDADLVP